MVGRKQEVFERVRDELAKRPHLALGVLHHMALQIDPSIERDPRSFHARYVAPIMYEAASERRRRTRSRKPMKSNSAPSEAPTLEPPAKAQEEETPMELERPQSVAGLERPEPQNGAERPQPAEVERGRIRAVFLEFASDLAAAESRVNVVRVLSGLDGYVERVVRRVE
jgi:hypothetical protein